MTDHDPEKNFEALWHTFNDRYPFFEVRGVDWDKQYAKYRPQVTQDTDDAALFDILCRMIAPINDGHIELDAGKWPDGRKRYFNPEQTPAFYKEFSTKEIEQLWSTVEKTLVANDFGPPAETAAWMLHYCRSQDLGYLRILELEGVKKKDLKTALDEVGRDFPELSGLIVDIRDCPGGDDDKVLQIIDRLCDRGRVAFHRRTKKGPGDDDYSKIKTWYMEPKGESQFTGPIVLLTCDSVFSGGEVFALAMRELPNVTIIGDHTNGIFSYQLEEELPNGWEFRLSYQKYFSAELVCYEGVGVPADIELRNKKTDIAGGVDPLIVRSLEVLSTKSRTARSAK
jgi:carboxyl-terminal processing protease